MTAITVRMGDADRRGRLRLDGIARYLQDVGHDDAVGDFEPDTTWVVRRVAVTINGWPRFMDRLETKTWCSGTGQRWAERSTTLGDAIVAKALWVYVDLKTLAPRRLPQAFFDRWGASAQGNKVSGRLSHEDPPDEGVSWRPWAVRATDLDVLDHVNNAAYWHAAEEVLADGRPLPSSAEIEYRVPVNAGDEVELGAADDGRIWLRRPSDKAVYASMVLR